MKNKIIRIKKHLQCKKNIHYNYFIVLHRFNYKMYLSNYTFLLHIGDTTCDFGVFLFEAKMLKDGI